MKLFLESSLCKDFDVRFIKTNHRSSSAEKGRLDFSMIIAFFVFFSRLLFEIARFRPKVVYYPVTATEVGWIGRDGLCLLICHVFRVRTIIHLRGSHLRLNFQCFSWPARRLVQFACRRVCLALVQAERLRNQFDGLLAPSRVAVLEQAIESDVYDRCERFVGSGNSILFLGNLTLAKGYVDMVRAIPLVVERFPDVKFIFAGNLFRGQRNVFFNQESGERIGYEDPVTLHDQMVRSPWSKNYEYRGIVYGKQKLALLQGCSLFALPSYSEGFSRAMLEAMSVGKPVVCTSVGAHPDVVIDGVNGFVISPGDVEALADRIICLLASPDVSNTFGKANYDLVRQKYEVERVVEKFGAYISDVTSGPNSDVV